jgi:hypothetical protein
MSADLSSRHFTRLTLPGLFLAVGVASMPMAWAVWRQTPRISPATPLPVSQPYKVVEGAVSVEAGFGAGRSFVAILDTGMADCLVSPGLAERSQMSGTGEVMLASPLGHLRGAPAGAYTMRVGRLLVEGLPLCVGDPHAQYSAAPPKATADAWLGNACLSLCTFEVDPATEQVKFDRPDAPPMRGGAPIPIDTGTGRVQIRARVNNGADFEAVVSTGLRGTLLPASTVRALKLTVTSEKTVSVPGGGALRIGHVRLKELRLGAAKITDVPVLAALDDVPGVGGTTGIIGTDVLLRFRMQINYMRKQAVFVTVKTAETERNRAPVRPTEQRMPGVRFPGRYPQVP